MPKKGNIPWNKGLTKETDNRLKSVSEKNVKNLWKNPEYRKHMIEVHKGQFVSESKKNKLRIHALKTGFGKYERTENIKKKMYTKERIEKLRKLALKENLSEPTLIKRKAGWKRYAKSMKDKNLPIVPTVGKNEVHILNILEECFYPFSIIKQYRVEGYFLDGYCPAFNLAIEIDEPQHKSVVQRESDKLREEEIKNELNCTFLRIPIEEAIT